MKKQLFLILLLFCFIAGKIQAQIKMLFPEQNLNLNLNLTILVDEEHAFLRAFKLLSLFKIKPEPTRLEAGKRSIRIY